MNNVIITGGLGFVGTNLAEFLLKDRDVGKILIIDDLSTGTDKNYLHGPEYIVDDFRNVLKPQSAKLFEDYNTIYHLAAQPRIQPSFDEPYANLGLNMMGTAQLCEFALKIDANIVYAGTCSADGSVHINPYTFSKWGGEEVIKMYAQCYGLKAHTARFYNVYGPRNLNNGDYALVLPIFQDQWKANLPRTVTGDGEQRRDFIHVADICQGLITLSEAKDVPCDTWALGFGKNYSINELAHFFGDQIEYISARKGEMRVTLCDTSKMYNQFGWVPQIDIKDYVENWIRRAALDKH